MSHRLELIDARDARVEAIWRGLEARAQPSYFLSWGFVGHWLATLPADEVPALAVIHDAGEPAAAFFVARRRVRRNLVLTSNALFFNATGSPRHDEIGIEQSGMLTVPGVRRSLSAVLDLLPDGWDEVFVPAIDRNAFDDLGAQTRYRVKLEREVVAPFVDLDAVRTVDGGYDALLPPSTRTQLHRTRALVGDVAVEVAGDASAAAEIFDELLWLHAQRWAARGLPGTFEDPAVEKFHRELIATRMPHGEIQLMRIKAGSATLGCLYNFIYGGHVLFYQCGLGMFDDPHIKPGYLCHALAIEHNAGAGHAIYDLFGGRARYKTNLATGIHRRIWLRVQRPRARFSVEDGLRRWYDLLVGDRLALDPAT